jgi:hypothetical protein
MGPVAELLSVQSGVIARRQALGCGLKSHDVRRLLRRREWATVHPGVYVVHTGPPTWLQRAWAAVLITDQAALCHRSAMRAAAGPGTRDAADDGPIHIAVDRSRTVEPPPGVVRHYVTGLQGRVQWNASPPRVRIEEAVLDLAAAASDDFAAIAALADAVQSRLTTAPRILEALQSRSRISRRDFLARVLADVAAGSCSVLEQGYLERVERAHGLPAGSRQVRASARGPIYRDVEYPLFGTVVELDSRLFHDSPRARDRDLDRDLDAAVDGKVTVRLGWGQVFGRQCETAPRIGRILQSRGWRGRPTPCPHCAVVPQIGATG